MNAIETAEIRKRFRADRSTIARIRGCCVSGSKEIISRFDQSLGLMPEEETERLLGLLKKSLSGTIGKNLLDLTFETRQVAEGEEQKLLLALRDGHLDDDELVERFFAKIASTLELEDSYLILLAQDTYDVPFKSKDGQMHSENSETVYSYLICSICPIKLAKPALTYHTNENAFRKMAADWVIAPPELGFLYPAFNDRTADIYSAQYYTRAVSDVHPALIDALFRCDPPMAAADQASNFRTILEDTLAEECSYSVVQAVQDSLVSLIETHKEEKIEVPLTIGKDGMSHILHECGVEDRHIDYFGSRFDAAFGEDAVVHPVNLVNTKKTVISTPEVSVTVSPEYSDRVQSRYIDGVPYLLIRADEGVEVNGIPVIIEK